MNFLKHHLFLFLGLAPVIYLLFLDLERMHATPFMRGFWVFGFACMVIYGIQRTRAFKEKLRSMSEQGARTEK
jgi:hypothetical protein